MSTRCNIAISNSLYGLHAIYCHFDGYPSHVGRILVEHHSSLDQARALVHGPQIRNFEHSGFAVRYGDGTADASTYYPTVEAAAAVLDYLYVFDVADLQWKCYTHTTDGALTTVDIQGNTAKGTFNINVDEFQDLLDDTPIDIIGVKYGTGRLLRVVDPARFYQMYYDYIAAVDFEIAQENEAL